MSDSTMEHMPITREEPVTDTVQETVADAAEGLVTEAVEDSVAEAVEEPEDGMAQGSEPEVGQAPVQAPEDAKPVETASEFPLETAREYLKDNAMETAQQTARKGKRSAEILAVFASHNFYANGFSPVELRTTMEELGPTYVKIGQILSSRTDILPEEYCDELAKLRGNVEPMPAKVARQVIEEETGRKIEDIYLEFNDTPLGSASIAQAHYGVLKDGTPVVTKVQRPLIADMMHSDFVLLHKIADFVGVVSAGDDDEASIDLGSVITELENVTEEELDFRVEAAHTIDFRERCIEDPGVVSCPTIIEDISTKRILTMTFVDGYSLSHLDRIVEDGYDREAIAQALMSNYLHQVLDVGMFHADPHQGNIMISHGVPYWIDFGMIGHVDDRSVNLLQTIILSLIGRDTEALTDAALAMGKTSGKVDKAKLIEDVDALIDRYATVGSLDDIDVGSLMEELTDLMERHHLGMPANYTMLVRSLITIEGVIEELAPTFDVFGYLANRMLERAKASFDMTQKLMEEAESMLQTGLRVAKLPSLTYDVMRNLAKGRMKMNLELTGYDELAERMGKVVKGSLFAAFSCVLFLGSCLLCMTNVQPQTNGVPLVALYAFVFSVALGIVSIRTLK